MITEILTILPWALTGCFIAIVPAAYLQDWYWTKKDKKAQTNN